MSKFEETSLSKALARIEELETKVAFQEHTMEALNDALAAQQHRFDDMAFRLKHIIDRVKTIEPSNIARQSEEVPPPHY